MREKLKKFKTSRLNGLNAKVNTYGSGIDSNLGCIVKCISLIDIIKDGELLTDHVWVNIPGSLDIAGIKKGDKIVFDADVVAYNKGPRGHKKPTDFKLDNIANIRKVIA